MKCPVCKGEKLVWFMNELIPCYVCKGKGKLEVSESRLEEYFLEHKERVKTRVEISNNN